MNLLAFDTSTEHMSIAVQRRGCAEPWTHLALGGAQASSQLIPQIQRLLQCAGLSLGELDAIAIGAGPGSFTGLRTACSVAQGLAFAAKLKVLAVDTLLAVAEQARQQCQCQEAFAVMAMLDARMDQIYAASYLFQHAQWQRLGDYQLAKPEHLVFNAAAQSSLGEVLAGNVFASYGARLPACWARRVSALPTATALLRLAPKLLASGQALAAQQVLPSYLRDQVAQTTRERALAQRPAISA